VDVEGIKIFTGIPSARKRPDGIVSCRRPRSHEVETEVVTRSSYGPPSAPQRELASGRNASDLA